MKRGTRRLLILALVLVAVGAVAFWGVRSYLGSHKMAVQVAERLSTSYGGPVELGRVEVGLNGTDLHDLRVFQTGANTASATPWLTAEQVNTDVSPWDLVRGETMPHRLDVDGATVTLDFDKDNHLLTRFPSSQERGGTLPEIHIRNARLTLRQQGRPEMVVSALDADLHANGEQLTLSGSTADPYWGSWKVDGSLNLKTVVGSYTLKTDRAEVTRQKLESLPFVTPKVWKAVQASGDSSVECVFRLGPKEGEFHYHVTLQPRGATISVLPAELSAADVTGTGVIDDGVIILDNVRGHMAGGEIHTTGTNKLDMMSTPERLEFHVGLSGVDVASLPKSWKVPQEFLGAKLDGHLTGKADLTLVLHQEEVDADGNGSGDITDLRLNGQPVDAKRMRIGFLAKGNTFSFPLEAQTGLDLEQTDALVVALAPDEIPAGAQQGFLFAPEEALKLIHWGINEVAGAIATVGTKVVSNLPGTKEKVPGPIKPPPNYLETSFSLEDVDVAQMAQGFKWKLPFPIVGRLTVRLQASVPVDAAGDMKLYRLKGTASAARLTLGELELQDVTAHLTYDNGILRLDELSARIPGVDPVSGKKYIGSFSGTAKAELFPQHDFTANLTLDQISLDRVVSLLPGAGLQISGAVNGNVEARAPFADLEDLTTWKASGTLRSDRLRVYGLTVTAPTATARLEKGKLTLSEVKASVEGAELTGSGEATLTGEYGYRAHVALKPMDLSALRRLAPEFRPPVAIEGRFEATADATGTLSPMKYKVSGTASASDLRVEGVKVSSLGLNWKATTDRVELSEVKAKLYGGTVSGSGVVPLQASEAGSIDARIEDVDVGSLVKDFPTLPVRLEGKAGGTVKGTLTAAKPERQFTGTLDLAAPRLLVQGIPTEKLTGTVNYRKGVMDYRLEGETLGGRFHLDGKVPQQEAPPGESEPEVHLKIERARLSRLGRALNLPALDPLGGIVNFEATVRFTGPKRTPVGKGQIEVRGLRWGDASLAETLQGDLVATEDELRLGPVQGNLGGGSLQLNVSYRFKEPDRSRFSIRLDGVESAQLVAPWPALAGKMSGPVDVRLYGSFVNGVQGGGEVALDHGRIYGVDVAGWHQPVSFSFAPGTDNLQIELRETTAQVAHGRVTGRASLRLGTSSHVEGHLHFTELDLPTLAHAFTDSTQVGMGRISGTIELGGNEVHSLNDLTATIQATLRQAQAGGLPVLQQIIPFVSSGQSSSALFNSGELKARLAGGVLRIQGLSLNGNSAKVFVEGTVTTAGRLDLQVTAGLGTVSVDPILLRLLRIRLPVVGPLPLTLLAEASTVLSNRVIHLVVLGTVHSPSISVQPTPLLTEEAVRYFILQGIPAAP